MNIVFFGSTSFAAQDLVNSLEIKYKTYLISRKKSTKKNFYYFDLNNKNIKLNQTLKIKKLIIFFSFQALFQLKKINLHGSNVEIQMLMD